MRSSAEDVLEYLIVKILAGKDNIVNALADYFIYGESPSVIALKYGLSKHQVRGYAQRIVEKIGSATKAKALLKYAIPVITKIRPVTKKLNGSFVKCVLCGDELPIQIIEDHIRKKHAVVVEEYLYSTIDLIRRSIAMESN
ncbi:hypothetical protein QPL79_01475 [Ignisphaera sp. 4213-co]|uniref:C2H2-type domain-containing protein n=1 Tax=Ignisphaera cupida TaxID=3050454 RepID=A0ABD4Z3Z7_9CREN|nr:hypothetical protein [Ignisphaera sp. 4213-co]MDK6028036.1 hypothetical protein [Ignisphaera sp. 4213-co]